MLKKFTFCLLILFFALTGAEARQMYSSGQTLYVPVYSHIFSGNKNTPIYLTVTLSIRNTDLKQSIEIIHVSYFDSEGKLIKKYTDKPLLVAPLAAKEFVIKESDKTGGAGASFIIRWKSDKPATEPIIETIMISTRAQQGISFTSRAVALEAPK